MLVTGLESRDTRVNKRGESGLWVGVGQTYSATHRREKGEDIPRSQLGCSRGLTEWSRTNLEGRLEGAGKMVRRGGSLQTETVLSTKTWKPGRRW